MTSVVIIVTSVSVRMAGTTTLMTRNFKGIIYENSDRSFVIINGTIYNIVSTLRIG